MFKHRIHAWGAEKKLKEDDVLHILRILAPECPIKSQQPYPFEFFVRGKRVEDVRLRRYIARTPRVVKRLYAGAIPSMDSVKAVTYRRVRQPGLPGSPGSPGSAGSQCIPCSPCPPCSPMPNDASIGMEQLLRSVRHYVTGSLFTNTWSFDAAGCWSTRSSPINEIELHDGWHLPFAEVTACWDRGEVSDNLTQQLSRYFDFLSEVVKAHPPFLLSCLLGMVLRLERQQQHHLSRMLIHQAASLSSIYLGLDHPLSQVMAHLRDMYKDAGSNLFLLQQCLFVLYHSFEEQVGPNNAVTLLTFVAYLAASAQNEGVISDRSAMMMQSAEKMYGSYACESYVNNSPWSLGCLDPSQLTEDNKQFLRLAMSEDPAGLLRTTTAPAEMASHPEIMSMNTAKRQMKFDFAAVAMDNVSPQLFTEFCDSVTEEQKPFIKQEDMCT